SKCLKAVKDAFGVRQFGEISLKKNTNYRLSFWGKAGAGSTLPKIRLNFDSQITRGSYSYDAAVSDDTGVGQGWSLHCNAHAGSWAQDYCIFNSGNNDHINWIGAWGVGGSGYAVLDDIQIAPETANQVDVLMTKTTVNDLLGMSVDVTNPANQISSTRSDSLGRVRVTKSPDYGVRRNLRYDANGNVIVSGDGDGTATCLWSNGAFSGTPSSYNCLRTTGFVYDALNRLRCVKYQLSTAEMDNTGGVWPGSFTGTCPSGSQVKYYYDTYTGTPTSCSQIGSDACTDVYSCPKERLVAVQNAYSGNSLYCYYYDALGQVRKERRTIEGTTFNDIIYDYDIAGNMISLTYPNSKVATYDFNVMNQLVSVKVDGNVLQSLSYRTDGLVQTKTYKRTC
ncbi:MAG: hypothetical protein V1743_06505, partial [Nanoarchaeota archaeon]